MSDAPPQASVVLATRNERCLRALDEQDVEPGAFEVVATAREAVGRVCIFLGDDVVPAPGLVAAHLAGHAEGGRVVGLGWLTNELDVRRSPYVGARRLFPGNVSVPRAAVGDEPDVLELVAGLEASGYELRRLSGAGGVRTSDPRRMAAEGAAHAELIRRHPSLQPRLLGWFPDATPRELVLRRIMLAARVHAAVLGSLGRVLRGDAQTRWSLFVANFAYWAAVRERLEPDEWDALTRVVPVLVYHAFGDEENRFVVGGRAFARQLRLLALLRFAVRPYADVARSLREGRLPPRTVALTIDDGYVDNAEIATPLLERHGFAATIFLVSGRLGDVNDWSSAPPLRGRRLLSIEDLGRLRARGVDFGAHTRTHADLSAATDDVIDDEVASSRAELEDALGEAVQAFAYPYGLLDERAVSATEDAGFDSACTTEPRVAELDDDPRLIPRIEIKRDDSLRRFVWKLWFGGA